MMVYEYTRPRVPIAASYTGPGPSYGLPGLLGQVKHDPTSRFYRAPAYHFGAKPAHYNDERSDGPGPCYMPSPKVYCRGKEVSPSCVIVNGRSEPKVFVTPGPAAYFPGPPEVTSRHSRPPAYSMTRAHSDYLIAPDKVNTPGPNAYNPDQMIGHTIRSNKRRAPSFTISSRNSFGGYLSDDCTRTPGPCDYGLPNPELYKSRKAPAVTLIGRRATSGSHKASTPGPGSHSPEKVTATIKRRPAFSFGIRHSQYVVPTPDVQVAGDAN